MFRDTFPALRTKRPTETIVQNLLLFRALREHERRRREHDAVIRFLRAVGIDVRKIREFLVRQRSRK